MTGEQPQMLMFVLLTLVFVILFYVVLLISAEELDQDIDF
jgi:sensor domain CHASE-containing protein